MKRIGEWLIQKVPSWGWPVAAMLVIALFVYVTEGRADAPKPAPEPQPCPLLSPCGAGPAHIAQSEPALIHIKGAPPAGGDLVRPVFWQSGTSDVVSGSSTVIQIPQTFTCNGKPCVAAHSDPSGLYIAEDMRRAYLCGQAKNLMDLTSDEEIKAIVKPAKDLACKGLEWLEEKKAAQAGPSDCPWHWEHSPVGDVKVCNSLKVQEFPPCHTGPDNPCPGEPKPPAPPKKDDGKKKLVAEINGLPPDCGGSLPPCGCSPYCEPPQNPKPPQPAPPKPPQYPENHPKGAA